MNLSWITTLLREWDWSPTLLEHLGRVVAAIGRPTGCAFDGGRETLPSSEEERAIDYLVLSSTIEILCPQWQRTLEVIRARLVWLLEHFVPDGRREEVGMTVTEGIRQALAAYPKRHPSLPLAVETQEGLNP